MKKDKIYQREGNSQTPAQEKDLAQQVMTLFQVDMVVQMQVEGYHLLPEPVKEKITNLLADVTICKIPARDNKNDLIFYLGKEARV